MKRLLLGCLVGTWVVASGCGKPEGMAGTGAAKNAPVASAPAGVASASAGVASAPAGGCGHAACADNFFVDAIAPSDCGAGKECAVTVKLVATGEFHVNDQYPYRFKADDAPGVRFVGTDAAGKNVFSKAAGDWRKVDDKGGAMTVRFTPSDQGDKTITGTLKLSVCSAQNCLLDQRTVSATVAAK